jgi:hypothetical protein
MSEDLHVREMNPKQIGEKDWTTVDRLPASTDK